MRTAQTALCLALLLPATWGCATASLNETVIVAGEPTADDSAGELAVILKNDLARVTHRLNERGEVLAARVASVAPSENVRVLPRDVTHFFQSITTLPIPVAGLTPANLTNSWGEPRDGGRRRHRGIDIFAPRGTEITSAADGIVSFKGVQPKGGNCLWVIDEDSGYSFYYAHLDAFGAGIEEGVSVRRGEVLGYVGNTGNARRTPPHLHFAVLKDDEAVNPYPLLTRAVDAQVAAPVLSGGFSGGGSNR